MRTINLPDLSSQIEDDTYLDKAIRNEMLKNEDQECNFQFPPSAPEYHVRRFNDVANKVNFWLETNNRPGKVTVGVYVPQPIMEVIPEPVLPIIDETPVTVEPEIITEEPLIQKKKKNV